METGFCKGQSDNLPKVSSSMMCDFFATNSNFISSEMRGVKASRSCREDYGDNAIGYVQVKRCNGKCTVKARITPEHKVKSKPYQVVFTCDEMEEEVEKCICEDCPASHGGCKHAVAFLSWLHRRSEEPSKTSIRCYWKKSKMAGIGTSLKFIKAQELGQPLPCDKENLNNNFFSDFMNIAKSKNMNNTLLTGYFLVSDDAISLSIHSLMRAFLSTCMKTADESIEFSRQYFTDTVCNKITKMTVTQSDCSLWHELRYGRVTTSKLYEAANCTTTDGSLVEYILGANVPKTPAIMRGERLEQEVFDHIKTSFPDIKKCGLILSKEYPIFGASPDGISGQYVFEIKCPMSDKWKDTYIRNGQPAPKFAAQMQLQMHFAKKNKGVYVVATPDYETTKELVICVIDYDPHLCLNLIKKAEEYWKQNIFKRVNLL